MAGLNTQTETVLGIEVRIFIYICRFIVGSTSPYAHVNTHLNVRLAINEMERILVSLILQFITNLQISIFHTISQSPPFRQQQHLSLCCHINIHVGPITC
jgi:hypothetical protein